MICKIPVDTDPWMLDQPPNLVPDTCHKARRAREAWWVQWPGRFRAQGESITVSGLGGPGEKRSEGEHEASERELNCNAQVPRVLPHTDIHMR